MRNGWTGGQYSLFRIVFGLYLFVHFVALVPWGAELFSSVGVLPHATASPLVHLFPNVLALFDAAGFVQGLLAVGALLSLVFALGRWDRMAALVLWYCWACLLGRNPLILNPSLPSVGWLLLAHVFLPPAPYGSWAARGRFESSGPWRMPENIFLLAWVLMALGYSYSGYTKLVSLSWRDGTASPASWRAHLPGLGSSGRSCWRCRGACSGWLPGVRLPWSYCLLPWRCSGAFGRGSGARCSRSTSVSCC